MSWCFPAASPTAWASPKRSTANEISDHVDFLRELGAAPLSLRTYLTDFVPRAARQPQMLADARWELLIADLAARLDQFAQDTGVQRGAETIAACPLRHRHVPACVVVLFRERYRDRGPGRTGADRPPAARA